jgi:hypothetical protein
LLTSKKISVFGVHSKDRNLLRENITDLEQGKSGRASRTFKQWAEPAFKREPHKVLSI